jgi:hypothetical protein
MRLEEESNALKGKIASRPSNELNGTIPNGDLDNYFQFM